MKEIVADRPLETESAVKPIPGPYSIGLMLGDPTTKSCVWIDAPHRALATVYRGVNDDNSLRYSHAEALATARLFCASPDLRDACLVALTVFSDVTSSDAAQIAALNVLRMALRKSGEVL